MSESWPVTTIDADFSFANLKLMRRVFLAYRKLIGRTSSGLLPHPRKGQTASDQSGAVAIQGKPLEPEDIEKRRDAATKKLKDSLKELGNE